MNSSGPTKTLSNKEKETIKAELRKQFPKAVALAKNKEVGFELVGAEKVEQSWLSEIKFGSSSLNLEEQVWDALVKQLVSQKGAEVSLSLQGEFKKLKQELIGQVNNPNVTKSSEKEGYDLDNDSEYNSGSETEDREEEQEEEQEPEAEPKKLFFSGLFTTVKNLFGGATQEPPVDLLSQENAGNLGSEDDENEEVVEHQPTGSLTLTSRPPEPVVSLFTATSIAASNPAVLSQPLPTPREAVDQMKIYKDYFDAGENRGCEEEGTRLKITIIDRTKDKNKEYYIQPSADAHHPGIDFIAALQENGEPDFGLILQICKDAADAAIAECEKNPSGPKVNFEISKDLPEDIRKAMFQVFATSLAKSKANPILQVFATSSAKSEVDAFTVTGVTSPASSLSSSSSSSSFSTPKPGGSSREPED